VNHHRRDNRPLKDFDESPGAKGVLAGLTLVMLSILSTLTFLVVFGRSCS
jgi:hypothetical protein